MKGRASPPKPGTASGGFPQEPQRRQPGSLSPPRPLVAAGKGAAGTRVGSAELVCLPGLLGPGGSRWALGMVQPLSQPL